MTETLMMMFYSAAAAIIAFALAMSFDRRAARKDQTICFAVLLLSLLTHVLGQLLIVSGGYSIAPHLAGAELSVRMALGPAVLFYTRSLISPTPIGFGGRDWSTLTGPTLVILAGWPFFLLSAEEKLALADPVTRDPAHFQLAVFACTAGVLLFLAFTTFYLIRALLLQARHRTDMMRQFANIEHRSLDWLRAMLVVFAGVWLSLGIKQALWMSGVSAPLFYVGLSFVEMLSIGAFAYLGLRQSSLVLEPKAVETSPRTPILTDAHMARLAAKLAAALTADRLYARSDLSLRMLSDVTGVTKNHISETLSQHLNVNFFDFVNERRVDEAKRLLAETDETVLAIGYEVGFNSRSTFNAAFKKHVGSTPSAYRTMAWQEASPLTKQA